MKFSDSKKRLLKTLAVLGIVAPLGGHALAAEQAFPARQIRVIVPFGTGTGVDLLARSVGQRIAEDTQQAVVVENRAGAGGAIGTIAVARSAPDGYTLLKTASPFTVAAGVDSKIGYDPVKEFTPVAKIATLPLLLAINAKLPYKDARQLIAYAKANPKKVSYAAAGPGTSAQLEMELFAQAAGFEMLAVFYKENTQLIADLIEGRVDLYPGVAAILMPHVQAGRLRIAAIVDTRRLPTLPDIPTVGEAAGAPNYQGTPNWYGFLAPAGTPPQVVSRLHTLIQNALSSSQMEEVLKRIGASRATESNEKFANDIKEEVERTARVAKSLGILK